MDESTHPSALIRKAPNYSNTMTLHSPGPNETLQRQPDSPATSVCRVCVCVCVCTCGYVCLCGCVSARVLQYTLDIAKTQLDI